jgi:hypothetical protein
VTKAVWCVSCSVLNQGALSCVIMQRRWCLLDKYCHIYKRIFIFWGKSSHLVGLPSCIIRHCQWRRLSEQTRCRTDVWLVKKMPESCRGSEKSQCSSGLFWSRETWHFFVLWQCCFSCWECIRSIDCYVNGCRMNKILPCYHM